MALFSVPPQRLLGRCRVIRDGGVKGTGGVAHDPSVRDYADTSPAKLGRKMRRASFPAVVTLT
jgi:hypothetical protein